MRQVLVDGKRFLFGVDQIAFCVRWLATNRPVANLPTSTQAEVAAAAAKGESLVTVSQDVRLDNRVVDLRTPANQAIFRVQSAVVQVREVSSIGHVKGGAGLHCRG